MNDAETASQIGRMMKDDTKIAASQTRLHDAMARFVAVWREMGTAGIARPPLPDELRDELVEVGILSAREV